MSNYFAGIPDMTHDHFKWALALAPRPNRTPRTFTSLHRDWPEQPSGYDVLLEYAMDILVELGHLEASHIMHYTSNCPDGMKIRQYKCSDKAKEQQSEVRALLNYP